MHTTLTRFAATGCFAFFLTATTISVGQTQEKAEPTIQSECTVDLSKPGQMSDIVSNALVRGFKKEPSKVSEFLTTASDKYQTGSELAVAAAKIFKLKEKTLLAAIEEYKHCNCNHKGGGAVSRTTASRTTASRTTSSLGKSDGKISEFAENVLLHVVLHELGHSLVREFDLPILGNEETLADAFATHYVVAKLPDRALQVLEARVSSLLIEAEEVPRMQWTVKGEHNSDARRAYQICAIAIAFDSTKFASLAKLVDMNESDKRKAIDYGSEVHRSWRRILKPLWMPDGQKSSEARVVIDNDSIFAEAISAGKLLRDVEKVVESVDWHSQVTVRFAGGEGGAGWNRSRRTITVYDEYIRRFNHQKRSIWDKPDRLESVPQVILD